MRCLYLAAIALATLPAKAAPSISLVDASDANQERGRVLVHLDEPVASLAFSLALETRGGYEITDLAIADPSWTPISDSNPFTGSETSGLYTDFSEQAFFLSYEASGLEAGTFGLADFDFSLDLLCGDNFIGVTGVIIADGSIGQVLMDGSGVAVDCFPGDCDNDGDIDIIDFGIFADSFGTKPGDPNYNPRKDFDNDGDVDIIDFGLFADNFGVGSASAVPELSTLSAVLIASVPAVLRRRARS